MSPFLTGYFSYSLAMSFEFSMIQSLILRGGGVSVFLLCLLAPIFVNNFYPLAGFFSIFIQNLRILLLL